MYRAKLCVQDPAKANRVTTPTDSQLRRARHRIRDSRTHDERAAHRDRRRRPGNPRPSAQFLEKHGFRVTAVPDGRSLRRVMSTQGVDLVVLDVMLPGGEDGLTICRQLSATGQIPIIMLTGRSDEVDRIIGLKIGADDYLAKPFNPRELLARVRNVLRRWDFAPRKPDAREASRYHFAAWTLDAAARELIDAERRAPDTHRRRVPPAARFRFASEPRACRVISSSS